jgi:tubulin polyglutamylase TTLL6/13
MSGCSSFELREYAGQKKNRTFICKPDASCQGKGIFLTRNIDEIDLGLNYVVQRYMHRPFLIGGLKVQT